MFARWPGPSNKWEMQLPEQAEQDFWVEMRQESKPVTEVPFVLSELGEEKKHQKTICTPQFYSNLKYSTPCPSHPIIIKFIQVGPNCKGAMIMCSFQEKRTYKIKIREIYI